MGADPNRGKTIRWTYADGPVKGKAFEHHFTNDGTVSWKEAADQQPSADSKTAKDAKDGSANDSSAAYEFARINDDVYVFSYLSSSSGYTLTTIVDERTGKITSFASNEKELVIQHGELDGAKRHAA